MLTPREERYCRARAAGQEPPQAYPQAYAVGHLKLATLAGRQAALEARSDVQARIEELSRPKEATTGALEDAALADQPAAVARAALLSELEEARRAALTVGQAAAAVSASLAKARLLGLVDGRHGEEQALSKLSDGELEERLRSAVAQLWPVEARKTKHDGKVPRNSRAERGDEPADAAPTAPGFCGRPRG